MAVGKATVIRHGVEVPYDPATMQGADPTLKGSGWIQKDGGTFYYDANTNTYNPLDKMKAIIAGNSFETVDRMVKSYGYNSPEEFLAAAKPIQAEVEQKQTETANKIATDPNNIPYNNPDIMVPVLPTDYAGQLNMPTPQEEMMLLQDAIANYKGGAGTQGIDIASTRAQQLMNQDNPYTKMVEGVGGGSNVEALIRSMYESEADPLRREAKRMQEANAADLAARGLGMSTVVNDINTQTQRQLMDALGDISNRADVAGRKFNLDALTTAGNLFGQGQAQQLGAAQDVAGYATQKQAQQLQGANAINQLINQQEARRLTNIQLPMQEWDKRVSNYWNYMGVPQTAYSGQNATQATAANVGQGNFQQANANAAGQNQLAGNVGSVLASAFQKQKPVWQNINTNTPATTAANSFSFGTIPQFKAR